MVQQTFTREIATATTEKSQGNGSFTSRYIHAALVYLVLTCFSLPGTCVKLLA
jgi:hypothetical protein